MNPREITLGTRLIEEAEKARGMEITERCPTISHSGLSQCSRLVGHEGACLFQMLGLKWEPPTKEQSTP